MKLMIGIPVLDTVPWLFFLQTCVFLGKLAKEYELFVSFPNRMAIDRARELIVQDAFRRECDYLLFIDDDTIVPFETVSKLLPLLEKDEKAISASGFCYQRGYSYMPMVYRYEDLEWGKGGHQLLSPWPEKPFQVSANGMGICLLKVKLLKKIEKSLGDCFGRDGAETEDFYFYKKANEMGFSSWLDPSLEATHMGPPLLINSKNVDSFRTQDHKNIYFCPDEAGGRAKKAEVAVNV